MRIEINGTENVELVCNGKLIAEFNAGGVLDAACHQKEIQSARVALVLAKQMALVTDWDAFADGVKNVLRGHPHGGVPGYVAPPEPNPSHDRANTYRANWDIGEFVRRFVSDDQLDLFGEVA
ncbi:hypothetical protein DFO67_10459 [Modicisalibacter xianhensis]|uniref:Uncharacterized protein n=1 Tax=Modicisalibacter xianhensis TaxID=442341 RepID=A0A4R8FVG6_9GAMM|nr:hypothetical protein [Halomonas xianhensis]TDX30804.1 hypothetical protein DFO67_10459 [Halomonas xianhensis]